MNAVEMRQEKRRSSMLEHAENTGNPGYDIYVQDWSLYFKTIHRTWKMSS